MVLLSLLPYVLQLLLIIHIIKNGKPFLWLWLIVFLPYIGGIVYIIMEILPEVLNKDTVSKAGDAVSSAVNPGKQILRLEELVKRQDTIANRTSLADAYVEQGSYQKALELYASCLTGPYAEDEELLLKKINALYLSGDFENAKNAMAAFKEKYPLSNASSVMLDLKLNGDWEKLSEIFYNTNNFNVGYECAAHFCKNGSPDQAKKILSSMEENLKLYKYLKRTENYGWYKKTKKLFS